MEEEFPSYLFHYWLRGGASYKFGFNFGVEGVSEPLVFRHWVEDGTLYKLGFRIRFDEGFSLYII